MTYGTLRNVFGSTRGFEALVGGNRVTLLHDGVQCFPAMLEAIAGAKQEILLEMYWFASDTIGRRFAEAIADKARAGVTVKVIYDAAGSFEADDSMYEGMRAAGAEVIEYHPVAPWRKRFRVGVVNNRDHRKMLIVDGRICFTGGVNIGDQWASVAEGGGGWRDDMIRVEGPAATQMRDVFRFNFRDMTGETLSAHEEVMPDGEPVGGDSPVRVVANHYLGERRAIRHIYLRRVRRARKRIFITNSYFVPDRVVRRSLARAVARGVEVRVLLPGESDLPAVYYAGRKLYPWLVEHGIQLYEWYGAATLHAKSAVIDGDWCTVGTYNLDYRSLRFNLEVTVAVEDAKVGGAMERRFEMDLEQARPLNLHDFAFRPLGERFFENFFYLFRKLL